MATWWLLNRMSNDWADHGLGPALKTAGIYDPESIVLKEVITPRPAADLAELSIDEVVKLTGDAGARQGRGRRAARCATPSTAPAPSWARPSTAGAQASRPP